MSVQEQINRLLWNRRLIVFPNELEVPWDLEYIVLRDLNLEDRNYYMFVRDIEERKARKSGVSTEGEIMEQARDSGYWGQIEDDIEKKADDHIAFLESEFESKKKFKSRQNIISIQIKDAKAKKAWVESKKNALRTNSAEYLAHEIASFMLLRRVAYRPDGTLLIPDDASLLYLKQNYILFLFYLIQEVMSEGRFEIHDIREIARSTEWRLTWTLCRENLFSIFGRNVGDMNINHKMLTYWSRVYDSAFENPEPPDISIINDDNLFDQWLADKDLERKKDKKKDPTTKAQEQGTMLDGYYVEHCSCGAKEQNAKKYLGERVKHDRACPHGTWHKYTAEEKANRASIIYGRNSSNIRTLIDKEQDSVLQRGVVEDQHLRDKKTRSILGMQTNVAPIRRK